MKSAATNWKPRTNRILTIGSSHARKHCFIVAPRLLLGSSLVSARLPIPNRSHAMSNRVSAARRRILKIGDRRLACEIERWWLKIRKIELQRPRNVSLTRGNVGRILVSGKHPLETRLAGWAARIRTQKWRISKCPLIVRPNFPGFWNISGPETSRLPDVRNCTSTFQLHWVLWVREVRTGLRLRSIEFESRMGSGPRLGLPSFSRQYRVWPTSA